MNRLNISDELDGNVDLLIKSDRWLEAQRSKLTQELSLLLDDLRKVMSAQKIKRSLQQTNRVAAVMPSEAGIGETVEILSLREAITAIKQFDEPRRSRYSRQVNLWASDGYDVGLVEANT